MRLWSQAKVQSHLLKLSKLCGEKAAHNRPPSVITGFGHCTRCSKKALVLPSSLTKKGAGIQGHIDPSFLFPHPHPGLAHHNNRVGGASVELDPRHNPLGLEEVFRFPETRPGFSSHGPSTTESLPKRRTPFF